MGNLIRDVRHAARLLLKSPAFTGVALLTLALGIGANTVVFSAFNAVMLRPLPYSQPERIVTVWDSFPQLGVKKIGVTYANFVDLKERSRVFDPLALYVAASNTTFNLTGLAGPERVQGARVTADFFRALGVAPLHGRMLTAEDEEQGRNRVAVLGYNLWKRDFGGDARVLDSPLKLNDEDYTVVGVMPPGFEFPSGAEMPAGQQFASATELWTPLTKPSTPAALNDRTVRGYRAIGRLKDGVTIEQAQADTAAVIKRLVEEHPTENEGLGVSVTTMRENQVGELRPAMIALLASVGFVLLIACANIANLLLSRAAARQREFAVRAALGASRGRIIGQLLTESLLLSLTGGALGLALAWVAARLLVALAPAEIPRINDVTIDLRVLAFTVGVSLLTGLLFGLAPALNASRTDLYEGVKSGGRGTSGGAGQRRLRGLLVVSEVMLVFVLLIAAGLMLKSFRRLLAVSPGFDPAHVLTARVTLPAASYPAQKKTLFYHQLVAGLEQQPGVQAAAVVRDLPLSGTDPRIGVTVEGRAHEQQGDGYTIRDRIISPDYFKVMGIPLLKGRYLDEHDSADAPGVAIINESAAAKLFPNEDPLGKVLVTGGAYAPDKCAVVGVVGDVKFGGLDSRADPEMYIPYTKLPDSFQQAAIGSMAVVARAAGDPSTLASAVRQQVSAIDRDVPVSSLLSMEEVLSGSLAPRRFNLVLLVAFASVALVLAAVGIYGVLSYWVTQRTREIGIRMALGASASNVFRLVVLQAMAFVAAGLLIGLGVALGLALFLSGEFSGLLFGVKATDPLTFASVGLLLALVALAACLVPARRATKVEPVVALRSE
ncbi:MAG TPA: ABC transporter permease [Pyrinomonadaceae bacterium]|nr:ABC transporter permease [Pyrinomonadaceae bacterium]